MIALRTNTWRGNPPPPLGHDPEGKVLGILGMGGIGRNLKTKMEAFGMKVQYHNRHELSEEKSGGAKYVGFEELLKTSDVISLNLPLNVRPILYSSLSFSLFSTNPGFSSASKPHTTHILSTPQFALMKPGVIIVNTARGAVMDEAALVKALDEGIVASVGLDVYEEEPSVHPGLVKNENVMLLPHMGTWTVEVSLFFLHFSLYFPSYPLSGGKRVW